MRALPRAGRLRDPTRLRARFLLCCANVDGSKEEWRCYLMPQARGLLSRRRGGEEEGEGLLEALERVLERDETIRDVLWGEA